MSVLVARASPLRFTDLLQTDGVTFWDVLDLPDIPIQSDDISYTTISTDRIDNLAARFYGDSVLWWVIALANGMELLPTDLHAGQALRIPSPRYVQQTLFKKAQGAR